MLQGESIGRKDAPRLFPINRDTTDRFACKRLNEKWKKDPTAQARFEREIVALKRMAHPAIVCVKGESLPAGTERFYLMPLYPRSLRHLIAERPQGFPLRDVAGFIGQLAHALEYAHGSGFIHRDIKPENVLLDARNNPVIADWGLGYFVHKESKVLKHLTRGGMGTEYYCSLEQWSTGKCGPSGDIYSLGILAAELLAGRQVPIRAVGLGIERDVLSATTGAARQMNTVLRWMTNVLQQARPQSMSILRQALMGVAARSTTAA